MYDHIILPTDGSTGTAHVALHAIELAKKHDATAHAVHVIDTQSTGLLADRGVDTDAFDDHAEKIVSTVERMANSHGVDCVTSVVEGQPAEQILEYADETEADLIVAGTHGRSGIKRHLIGSVTERVVRHSDCPVLTIRLPETDITVDSVGQAKSLIKDALAEEGYDDAPISTIERQLSVWVATAETGDSQILVYLDPETQRTSVHQSRVDTDGRQ